MSNPTVHILTHRERFQRLSVRCGYRDVVSFRYTSIEQVKDEQRWVTGEPTCESCILLHFSDPSATHHVIVLPRRPCKK